MLSMNLPAMSVLMPAAARGVIVCRVESASLIGGRRAGLIIGHTATTRVMRRAATSAPMRAAARGATACKMGSASLIAAISTDAAAVTACQQAPSMGRLWWASKARRLSSHSLLPDNVRGEFIDRQATCGGSKRARNCDALASCFIAYAKADASSTRNKKSGLLARNPRTHASSGFTRRTRVE